GDVHHLGCLANFQAEIEGGGGTNLELHALLARRGEPGLFRGHVVRTGRYLHELILADGTTYGLTRRTIFRIGQCDDSLRDDTGLRVCNGATQRGSSLRIRVAGGGETHN